MARIAYQKLEDHSPLFWGLLALNGLIILAGLSAAYVMEHRGHIVTGMNNQIVWGLPHVFAVFLIVAASGALNVASISSVFDRLEYKPYARLSGVLAIALLVGGLAVLVLDLGRPDRLIVAMTTYNFKSIFAWNIFLYVGFLVICRGLPLRHDGSPCVPVQPARQSGRLASPSPGGSFSRPGRGPSSAGSSRARPTTPPSWRRCSSLPHSYTA